MHSGIGILAAQSVLGGTMGRSRIRFGPFRKGQADLCVRCGFLVPSLQTGGEVCQKTGWCQSCTRIPAHVTGNLLRECLNIRREQSEELRPVIESWQEQLEGEKIPFRPISLATNEGKDVDGDEKKRVEEDDDGGDEDDEEDMSDK